MWVLWKHGEEEEEKKKETAVTTATIGELNWMNAVVDKQYYSCANTHHSKKHQASKKKNGLVNIPSSSIKKQRWSSSNAYFLMLISIS